MSRPPLRLLPPVEPRWIVVYVRGRREVEWTRVAGRELAERIAEFVAQIGLGPARVRRVGGKPL